MLGCRGPRFDLANPISEGGCHHVAFAKQAELDLAHSEGGYGSLQHQALVYSKRNQMDCPEHQNSRAGEPTAGDGVELVGSLFYSQGASFCFSGPADS